MVFRATSTLLYINSRASHIPKRSVREAQSPRIHLLRVEEEWGSPSVSVEIVVETLAVIIYYALDFEHAANRLFQFS